MPEPEYFKERRIFHRFTINIPASYVDPLLNKTLNAQTHDISVEGLGLVSERKLTVGTILEICLQMTDNGEKIVVKGKVVWLTLTDDNKYRAGIKLEGPRLEPVPLVLRTIQSQLNSKSSYYRSFLS